MSVNYRSCDREIVQKRKDRAIGRLQEEREAGRGQRPGVPLPHGAQQLPVDVSQLGRQQPDLALYSRTKKALDLRWRAGVINTFATSVTHVYIFLCINEPSLFCTIPRRIPQINCGSECVSDGDVSESDAADNDVRDYRDSVGFLATAKVRLHLRLDQLYVIVRDGGRKVPRGLVFEPIQQLLNHQGHREPVVRLHSVPIASSAGNDCHRAAGLHVLQAEHVPILPLYLPCKFCQETTIAFT